MTIASFFVGVAVGFILGLMFTAITAGSFGRRRSQPNQRTWPLPPDKENKQ